MKKLKIIDGNCLNKYKVARKSYKQYYSGELPEIISREEWAELWETNTLKGKKIQKKYASTWGESAMFVRFFDIFNEVLIKKVRTVNVISGNALDRIIISNRRHPDFPYLADVAFIKAKKLKEFEGHRVQNIRKAPNNRGEFFMKYFRDLNFRLSWKIEDKPIKNAL